MKKPPKYCGAFSKSILILSTFNNIGDRKGRQFLCCNSDTIYFSATLMADFFSSLTARQKRQLGFWGVLVAIFAVIILFASMIDKTPQSKPSSPPASPAVQSIDKSPEMQRKRQEFIDSMIKQGIFSKVEMPGSVPYVWVRPRFNTIDFESKTTAMSIVYAFYFSDMSLMNFVGIRDHMTGKTLGRYSPNLGLNLE